MDMWIGKYDDLEEIDCVGVKDHKKDRERSKPALVGVAEKDQKDLRVSNNNNNETTIHEAAVGKGLGGTLKLLKGRGTLNHETIELGGRNMDKKKSKLVGIFDNNKYAEKEIRIDRTDEFGRIMTPKEAFRQLSYVFHAKGPGKKKQEKRIQQFHEELKKKQMPNSLWAERMREAQAQLQTPYLVLSGGPRSGFATVEKDFAGGFGDSKKLSKNKRKSGDHACSNKKPKTRGRLSPTHS